MNELLEERGTRIGGEEWRTADVPIEVLDRAGAWDDGSDTAKREAWIAGAKRSVDERDRRRDFEVGICIFQRPGEWNQG